MTTLNNDCNHPPCFGTTLPPVVLAAGEIRSGTRDAFTPQ